MNSQLEQWVGIEVSKAALDVCLEPSAQQWRSPSTAAGIAEIVATLTTLNIALVVLEATSGLEQAVTQALTQAGIAVVVSTPVAFEILPERSEN